GSAPGGVWLPFRQRRDGIKHLSCRFCVARLIESVVSDVMTRRSLITYLALTAALSAIFYAWAFSGAPLLRVTPLLMWMPGVAAIATQLGFQRTLAGLGWRPGPWRYLAFALCIPVVYCSLIYGPVWLTGVGRFDGSPLRRLLPYLPLALAAHVLVALGEEIGWRGFLAPAFYRVGGFRWAAIGTG